MPYATAVTMTNDSGRAAAFFDSDRNVTSPRPASRGCVVRGDRSSGACAASMVRCASASGQPRVFWSPEQVRLRHTTILSVLLGLFAIRVIAQPMSLVVSNALIPPFESWYSGVVPYPVLLAAQVAILVALA